MILNSTRKKAQKKLRAFVESDSYTIDKKAAMMVEHFHEQVIAKGKSADKLVLWWLLPVFLVVSNTTMPLQSTYPKDTVLIKQL